jgi:type II secretion system protein G
MLQRSRNREDEGFTLIELLIVIIILGILAAIVVFAIGSTRGNAVNAACKTDVKSIQLGTEAVKTKTGSYPTNQASMLATATATDGQVLKAWPGGTDATKDELVFTYTKVTGSTYTLDVAGKNLTNSGKAAGTLTQDSTDAAIETACTSS